MEYEKKAQRALGMTRVEEQPTAPAYDLDIPKQLNFLVNTIQRIQKALIVHEERISPVMNSHIPDNMKRDKATLAKSASTDIGRRLSECDEILVTLCDTLETLTARVEV